MDGDRFHSFLEGRPDGGAKGRIHSGRVTSAGQDAEAVFPLLLVHQ
jgi:hypothetical protein